MHKHGTPELSFLLIFSVLSATRASKVAFACPTGWNIIGTHCYNFVQIRMDIEDARDVCDKYGAQLLVVRDEVEARDVSSVALQRFNNVDNFWVYNGRYEQDSGNGSLNSTFCTGMWQINEPRETDEDVAIASNMQGRWALTWVWTNLPFVCRKPACPVGSFQCSDGSCINTMWKCDGAYDCKDSSDENDCSDGVKYYTRSTGTVDTSDMAADGDFYQWIIEGQPGEVLRIEFDTITIEDHVENVRVYSGGPSIVTSDLIQDIRTSSPQKISLFSKNHFLIVTLQSYTKSRQPTVKFNWKPDTEASWKQVDTLDVTKEASFISSPYYDSSVSPVSFKREWLLIAPEGELITLEVLDSTMELNAISDFYIVTNVGFILKDLNSHKGIYISSKNSMSVIVKTRSLKKLFQFNASFRKGCDLDTKLSLATFAVTNFPANTLCTWIVENEVGTNFSLQITETATDDSSDALQIYSGTGTNPSAIIGTLNHSTTGFTEHEYISGGVSFTYSSDNVRPSLAFTGNISADCPELRCSKIVIHNKTKIAGGGYKAKISCPMGFTFKQEEYNKNTTLFAVCNEGGRWDWLSANGTRTPECQIVYCGFPPTIQHGFVSGIYGNVTYGSVASYQCSSGFGLVGDSNVTCKDDGTWSVPPSCVGAAVLSTTDNCTEIGDLIHGNSKYEGGSEGSIVTFSCDPGYSLHGARSIVCLPNKAWSHPQPVCKELTCPLPVIEHGQYENKSIPQYGQSVTLVCDSGYQINRTQTRSDSSIICDVNRKLNIENDVCVDVDECKGANNCFKNTENCINLIGSYVCVCKNGYSGSDCKDVDECAQGVCHQNCTNLPGSFYCSCQRGYVLYTANGTSGFYIPPGEDGLKPGDVFQINHTCVPITCNRRPVSPANGKLLLTRATYYYNDQINILCDFGYALENPLVATCQSDGNWAYTTNLRCKKMTCPQPPVLKHEAFRVPAYGDIEPGASLTITCNFNDGSGRVTNKTVFCAPSPHASERFSLQGDNLTCPEVNCGKPFEIPGGKAVNLTDTTYGSYFNFACDSNRGFTISGVSTLGNSTVLCQSSGSWGFANLSCEGARCKDPGTRAGTVQIVRTSYAIDQIVQYNCTRPGFTTVTNDTLVCEYKNGTVNWSSEPPTCEDTQPPKIKCPTVNSMDLYSTLLYPDPTVMDNSGFSCLILESGPPSGVSVVTNNVTVRYMATDSRNDAYCEFNVTVKDRSEPSIQCPSGIQQDLAGHRHVLFNLTETLLVSHSGDGVIIFNPKGPLNLTIETVIPVRVRIAKENGLVKECAFLVSAVSTTCSKDSLPTLDNGRIGNCSSDGKDMTCVGVCDEGYLFQTAFNSASFSCENGKWNMDSSAQSCIKIFEPIYTYDVSLQFLVSGRKVPPTPQYDAYICLNTHYDLLSQLVQKMSACGYHNFTATDFKRHEIGATSDEISFKLHLFTTDRDEANHRNCAATLQNQSATLFGPTYPVTGNMSCYSPWKVIPNTATIVLQDVLCSNNFRVVDYKGIMYCLPCGPGMLFNTNTTICEQCQDGYYQDEEGQAVCKKCPNGVHKSHIPRTKKSNCFGLCPEGFISTSGFIEDNCTACTENQFSISSNSCQPCPNNGSTLGISGATSVTQCSDPCLSGEYSITGFKPCSACPKNFYSDSQGAKICTECPSNTTTAWIGSKLFTDCINGNSLCTPNFCYPAGTMNTTTCEIIDHRPVCSCRPGFYGDSCDKSCDVCNPNPCYNGGLCTASGLNFTCTCEFETACTFTRNQHIVYDTEPADVTITSVNGIEECEKLCLTNSQCLAYLVEDGQYCFQYNKLVLDYSDVNPHESYVKNCSVKQHTACAFTRNQHIVYDTDPRFTTITDSTTKECEELCLTNSQCVAYLVEDGQYCFQYNKLVLDYSDVNPHESYVKNCSVKQPFDGPLCERDLINDCTDTVCTSIEFCRDLVGGTTCQCPHHGGSYDSNCARLDDPCKENNCSHHGNCISYGSVHAVCECHPGYTGVQCEINIDECDLNQQGCLFNGICQDGENTYICSCVNGFYGRHCENKGDLCDGNDCKVANGGICTNDFHNLTASCTCGEHYMPDSQNPAACVPINYCMSNPCGSGTCTNLTGGFRCDCPLGFEGPLCKHDIDDCVGHGCENGATCLDGVGYYTCNCLAGFAGQFCEVNIDDCSGKCVVSNTQSACQDLVEDYYCPCKPAYTGKNCSESVDMCTVYEPCFHGASCSNFPGGYHCTCAAGWTGVNCEQEIDYCRSNSCLNGGTCYSLMDQYFCRCLTDATGRNCEQTENMCETFGDKACSSNGKCEVAGRTVACQCQEEYCGVACELEKDRCAARPCNSGICTQNHLTYFCDCSNVKNYGGKHCNETKHSCSECPKNTTCLQFKDQEGYSKLACLCQANETLVGDTCKTVDRDYDLAFMESFANKGTFLTSENGFYLDKNTSLSVSMWVAAAKPLDDDKFLLALRSSEMDSPFLSVFNARMEFSTNTNISVELTDDIDLIHSMDKSFTWHFLSIVWATNGSLKITFDFVKVIEKTIPAVPLSHVFVFVDIGQSFYGYISQVSVWKTALTFEEHFDMFTDKLAVPQPDSLLLGWTQYSFDFSVKIARSSTAARSLSICDIENTIAKMGLNSTACKHIRFADKTPPEVNNCRENAIITTDYSKHQFSSSDLGYKFTDDTDGELIPESQLFSYGASDIAVSSADSAGNIGVCMTRTYITPNQCSDMEPSAGLVAKCSDNMNGRKVTCPSGMLPSVPTPNYVSCSSLRTYNMDNMYEKPDRIVCGDKKLVSVYVNIHLHYTLVISCDEDLETQAKEHLESIIMNLNNIWIGLCSDAVCSNVIVNGTCTGFGIDALIQITGLNASESSSGYLKVPALKFLKDSVADKTVFDISEIAIAHLEDHSKIDQIISCSRGYARSGINCVECGPGSYYDDAEMKCKLCQLNTYSEHSGSTSCTPCQSTVTLQRGSSSLADCKVKCPTGSMLYLITGTCQPCPGYFCQDQPGKSYCFPCPPATRTASSGTIHQTDFVAN